MIRKRWVALGGLMALAPTLVWAAAPTLDWRREFETGGSESVPVVRPAPEGGILLAGMGQATSTTRQGYVLHYSPQAALSYTTLALWYEVAGMEVHAASGARYVSGTSHAGTLDGSVAKISSAGSILWTGTTGRPDTDNGGAVAVDAAGNAYLASTAWNGSERLLSRFNAATGARRWSVPLPGTEAFLEVGPDGNPIAIVRAGTNVLVVKFSAATGATLWSRGFGVLNGSAQALDTVIDGDGSVYVAGRAIYPDPSEPPRWLDFKVTAASAVPWAHILPAPDADESALLAQIGSGGTVLVAGVRDTIVNLDFEKAPSVRCYNAATGAVVYDKSLKINPGEWHLPVGLALGPDGNARLLSSGRSSSGPSQNGLLRLNMLQSNGNVGWETWWDESPQYSLAPRGLVSEPTGRLLIGCRGITGGTDMWVTHAFE